MATTNKGLNLPSAGSTGWNVPLNANSDILDKAFGSFTTVSRTSGEEFLTSDNVQNMCIKSTTSGFLADVTYVIPSGIAGQWVIQNLSATTTIPHTLTVRSAGVGTSVTIPIGTVRSIYSDGTNVVYADTPSSGEFVNATVSGTLTVGGTFTLGGGNLTGVSSQAQAQAGMDNTTLMTPLRTRESVTAAPTLNTSAVLNAVATSYVSASGSSVGSYAYASSSLNGLNTGDGVAGGSLSYCLVFDQSGTSYVGISRNNSLVGSWRLMSGNFVTSDENCGLFVRYA